MSCPRHEALIARALGPDPSDADLEAYADQVPTCPECNRRLSVEAGIHPALLERPGGWSGVQARMQMPDPAVERLVAQLDTGRRWRSGLVIAAAGVLLAVGALASRAPKPPKVAAAESLTVPVAPTPVPEAVVEVVPATPRPRAPAVPAPVVASLVPEANWPAPPFVELRSGTLKSGAVRDLHLEVGTPERPGDSVRIAVLATSASAVTVCVAGPETGVVWRGGVPMGRVVLTRDGHAVRYAFPSAGVYTFSLSAADDSKCGEPVHVVEVTL